ncbi:LytR/AlgR family response regulator transcription factor [Hymenobacter cavernae]|uniref:DNA-binding response regulator n=1 Tax=Hymenobacter cavernae TaxID=2044852 RepID=A0ABQ1UI97_9BACT|nr:LytTR family DNA-binding domain-containing protein [Hymenobacter cavernae]GGF18749.1 DNA-binding response regulator [Hymenobacter cavernae]
MKMTCVLLDDDPIVLDLFRTYIGLTDALDLKATFTNPLEAHAFLIQQPVQVLFLDVAMPQLSGLELLRALRNPPLVVLLTAYPQYALEGFDLDVADFLLKPVSLERFLKAVTKVSNLARSQVIEADDSFFIRADAQYVRLYYHDVLYIEALKDFTKLHTTDGRTHLTLVNLKNLEEQLPPGLFVRTHRSYLVNARHIDSITNLEVRIGTCTLPLGQTYREQVTERLVSPFLIRRQH